MVVNSLIAIVIMSILVLSFTFGAIKSIGQIFSDIVAGDIVQELEKSKKIRYPKAMRL